MRQGSTFCDAHSSNRSRGTPTARARGPKPLRRWHEGSSTAVVKQEVPADAQCADCVCSSSAFVSCITEGISVTFAVGFIIKFEDYCLLGYDVRYFGRKVPTFRSNLLSPYSGRKLSPDPCKSSLCGA